MSEDAADGGDGGASDADTTETGAERAIAGFDEQVVDVLAWILDTETRARIYVYLRQHPWSTSEEVAEGTGLYPSTVREALAELAEESTVERRKRQSEGAGNNPYEYTAVAPSDLVREAVTPLQEGLNALCNLDTGPSADGETTEAVSIEVTGPGEDPKR